MMALLIPLIVFDLAFLPMFHLYGVPFKPSYLLIGFLFLRTILYHPSNIRGLNRDILSLFLLLSVVTLMGSLVMMVFYGGTSLGLSVRNLIIYAIAPMAFVVGTRDTRPWHNYIIVFILAYSGVTLLFSVYYQQLDGVVSFYGLQDQIDSGVYSVRSQGLFANANISALFMTMLFLYFIGGVRHGFIKAGVPTIMAVIAAVLGTIVVLGSRNQFMAATLLTLLLVLPMLASRRRRTTVATIAAAMGLLVIFSSQLGSVAESKLGYDPWAALTRTFGSVADTSHRTNSFLRPIRSLEPALDRWVASPLVGTGFDSTGIEPFGGTSYHNDWFFVLTSSGILGLFIFSAIVFRLTRLDLILLVPFLLPGMTNSFIFAPSHLFLFMLIAGMIWRCKPLSRQSEPETTIVTRDLPPAGQHAYAG